MTTAMTLQFWGVRGSIPTPGPSTMRYGGNTACVSVDLGHDTLLVLDAGTGIRPLGEDLAAKDTDIFVLLSHAHWDHIQGFPFFAPIYQPHRLISILPTRMGHTLWCPTLEQMDGMHFPVTLEDLPARVLCLMERGLEVLQERGCHLSWIATNHPGGGTGYRIERAGRSLVYLTDNELEPPYEKATSFDEFATFCRQTDVLIHDAQYLQNDMPAKHGWGHSLVPQACQLAVAAEVKHLILFHHDPARTDDGLDAIQEEARAWIQTQNRHMQCTAAYEGLVVDI
jgi:phosphoribosyl 1,2-cyclic phosphodiesterase